MKNLILNIVFVFAAILQLSANNAPKGSTIKVINNEKSILLNLKHNLSEVKNFSIIDNSGDIIFTDAIDKNKITVKYNLENLPSGKYIIKVQGNNFVEFIETVITNNFVNLIDTETYFRPVVKNMDHKVLVNALLLGEDDIQLNIYNENDVLVYDYSDKTKGSYIKTFNLEELVDGNYTVVVSTDNFTESLTISI